MEPKTDPPEHIIQFFSYEHLPPHLQAGGDALGPRVMHLARNGPVLP